MTKIIIGSAVVIALGTVFACGSASPESQCESAVSTTCQKLFQCLDSATLQTMGYASEGDCETKQKAQDNCANATAQCAAPKVYNSSAADQCLSGLQSMSCDDLKAGKTPPVCQQVCQ